MSGKLILVTGGAGFIGSHTVVELYKAGYKVAIIDNFVNAKAECKRRLEHLVGETIPLHEVDLLDVSALGAVFTQYSGSITAVIHFAALKAVGESVQKPLRYYRNNLVGTLNLLETMDKCGVKRLIFSSSATVYGEPQYLPLNEVHPTGLGLTNPYGKTKHMVEEVLRDLQSADPSWSIVSLRYFNPSGAHESGLIGEDPSSIPNNLMPYISQVAVGRLEKLQVFGGDYDTVDGTGVRDYIHVVDLALGHVAALKKLNEAAAYSVYNLGTGIGYSVLQMVAAFEAASGRKIPHQIVARRGGDVANVYADPKKALEELGWKTTFSLADMCRDLWKWQEKNPQGFATKLEL